MITLKVRDFRTLVKEECDNNTNPLQARTGHTNPVHSSYKQQDKKKRAESRESEEEEHRFYSVLMLEPKSHKKESRSDRLNHFSQGVRSYKASRVCSVLSGGV